MAIARHLGRRLLAASPRLAETPGLEEDVRQALEAQFYERPGVQSALPGMHQAVAEGQLTPWPAAGQLLTIQ